MGDCRLANQVRNVRVSMPKEVPVGERLIGHNLAVDKVLDVLRDCPLTGRKYTSWYVVLRCNEDGAWEPVRCIDRDDFEDGISMDEKWDLILPIPHPEGILEWEGP